MSGVPGIRRWEQLRNILAWNRDHRRREPRVQWGCGSTSAPHACKSQSGCVHYANPRMNVRIHKKSVLITNIGEWEQNAGPKLEHQWAPGRSALECATAWCEPDGPVVPSEFAALFAGHQFAGFEIECVQPEHCIRFDNLRGGPRNADLAIEATDRNGRIAITVEAKADEPFDGTLDEMMMAALEARLKNPRSGA